MRPLRIGVLGAGVIATAEYGVLPNMVHLAGKAAVTAIADIVPGRAEAVADRFGIPIACGSLADMLADADIALEIMLKAVESARTGAAQDLETTFLPASRNHARRSRGNRPSAAVRATASRWSAKKG